MKVKVSAPRDDEVQSLITFANTALQFTSYDGQLETMSGQLDNLRHAFACLLNRLANAGMLSTEDLQSILQHHSFSLAPELSNEVATEVSNA